MADSVETATAELMHALGNFLAIVMESRLSKEHGKPRMMDDAEVGRYAMSKEPELSAALDALRGAMSVARIETEDW